MSSQEMFNCVLCKDVFADKKALQTHFRKHGDPNFNVSQKSRQSDDPQGPVNSANLPEMVNCDVCDEQFPTISKAITHKHKAHPDHESKYFCPWCGKLFTLKHLYNKHLQTNHDKSETTDSFHCDPCNVDFHIPSAMIYHNRYFHRQDTEMPAIGHSKKQKLFNQELLLMHYCPFCGEEYNNKVNLHKHMQDDHMDENQSPEEVLRCPMCDAIFYHLDAYELHLTFHSTDDIYSEKNEMLTTLTEFSLDTVPPTMEKVQTWEPQANAESSMNAMGIEKFLELAMDESNQSSGEPNPDKVKSKKRKKHKKSKKPAITLDEFLSMNQDVFGEDLDFQGAEEVPTRMIAKQIKTKKKPHVLKTGKIMNSADLQKLKKQGVLVKVKSGRDSKPRPNKLSNVASSNVLNTTNPKTVNSNIISLSTTNDVLSKLLNQSNNQIKILKKPAQDSISVQGEDNKIDEQNLSETTNKLSSQNMNITKEDEDETNISNFQENVTDKIHIRNNLENFKVTKCVLSPKGNARNDMVLQKENDESNDFKAAKIIEETNDDSDDNSNKVQIEKKISNAKCPLNTLRNIGQNITIKPVLQSTNNVINRQNIDNELSDHAEYTEEELQDNNTQINNTTKSLLVKNEHKSSNESMTTIKHLSSQLKVTKYSDKCISDHFDHDDDKEPNDSDFDEHNMSPISMKHEEIHKEGHLINKPPTTMDTLKIIGNQITVKALSPSIKSCTDIDNTPRNKDDEHAINQYEDADNFKAHNSNRGNKINSMNIARNIDTQVSGKLLKLEKQSENNYTENEGISKVPLSINLLKHLKHVTAKPVLTAKTTSQIEVKESLIQSPNFAKYNVVRKRVQNKEVNEEIEIFNIDDSDSETDNQQPTNTPTNKKPSTNTVGNVSPKNVPVKSIDALKNISKNITIKSMNPNPMLAVKNSSCEEQVQSDDDFYESNFSDNENDDQTYKKAAIHTKYITHKLLDQNKMTFNTLKKLGKHITVKSRNSSPSLSHSSQDQNSQDSNDIQSKDDSDEDFCSGNIKITELCDDHESNTEMSHQMNKNNDSNFTDNNAIVQFPHDSNSDDDEQFSDIESQIKPNMLKKPSQQPTQSKQSLDINKLKNISKNITIKSLSERNIDNDNCSTTTSESLVNTTNETFTKPMKRVQAGFQSDDGTSNSKTNSKQVSGQFQNQAKINQKISSSNQMNTVNKEVTVKTFKTQTVVQEITTTITKTIRTINQSVNQQLCNAGQTSSVRAQKVLQGPKTPQRCKNYQAVPTVRQTAPSIRPNSVRPGTAVRPSNALVPVRPGLNIRPCNPRPSIVNKIMPSTSNQLNRAGQPLKVLPNTLTQVLPNTLTQVLPNTLTLLPNTLSPPAKRPCPINEPTKSFGGFKKPKDIMAEFDSDNDEAMVQYSSASHTSKSNLTSTTKTVKGGAMVTSTKMKSEVSASSQQLSRLGNVSGLVVKSNQSKQGTQVEKKSEVTATKQTTLEAIEKLQKQGLLVKKPRVEESDWMSDDDEVDNGLHEDE